MTCAILIALLNPWVLLSLKVGSEEWPSSQRYKFICMMGGGLNLILVTSERELVQASLWAYLKILDLVSNEYPDPRLPQKCG